MGEHDGASAAPPVSKRHPAAIWFFFWGEFAERSSYYGMRTILTLYLTTALGFSTAKAGPIYSVFKLACYALPLLGGWIADRFLGRYWTIVGFSIPYVFGQFLLGWSNEYALYGALVLLAMGSGVIKPNISTLMGQTYDQKRPGQEQLRSAAFLWFYLAINIGALISSFALPVLREHYIYTHLTPEARAIADSAEGKTKEIADLATDDVRKAAFRFAFQFPAWLMVAALLVFALGKRTYAVERVEPRHELTDEERRLQWQTLRQLFGIFGLVVLFWIGYEHNDTLWIVFIRDYVDLRVPGLDRPIAPDQLAFLNALFVVICVPLFNFLFGRLDPKAQIFTPMRKILAGFILTAVSVGIMSLAGFLTQGHTIVTAKNVTESTVKVSVYWPAMAYIVLTVGEVLLYGTMLELAYAAAPKSMKGFITACFLTTSAFANFINIGFTTLYGGSLTDPAKERGPLPPGEFFGITAGIVLIATVAFFFLGKRFERSQVEREAAEAAKKVLEEGGQLPGTGAPAADGITRRDQIV